MWKNIPENLFIMSVKVYVISEPLAVDLLVNNDIDGFKELLDSDKTLYFPEPKIFDTEEMALAFCANLGYGKEECARTDRYPLRRTCLYSLH